MDVIYNLKDFLNMIDIFECRNLHDGEILPYSLFDR